MDIEEDVLNGSRLALSRAITAVENEDDSAVGIMQKLHMHTGKAYVIGITGPPGAGKSTLTDKLVKHYRKAGKAVGIIAIDPTSPFSGGAILGDRIRMSELTLDSGVFIRSVGTRGSLGGLSRKTANIVKIFDASGKDIIFIETVGVGQSEIDIAKTADTTVVVLVPGLGDDIQPIKAVILEIGDVFAVNKADNPGSEKLLAELGMMLDLNQAKINWRPPVKQAVASKGEGIAELASAIDAHACYLAKSGELQERRRLKTYNEILLLLNEHISRFVLGKLKSSGSFEQLLADVQENRADPYNLINEVLNSALKGGL